MKTVPEMKETEILRKYWDWRWAFKGEDSLLLTNLKTGKQVYVERVKYTG